MNRREFITMLGGATAAWPIGGRAQQSAMPVIGFLRSNSLADAEHLLAAFRQGLAEAGFVEGRNVAIETRSAEGHNDRLPALVTDLIRRPVAVIVANNISAIAAKAVTTTVPIVFTSGSDPVREGLVTSLNRPGGNVTGAVFITGVLGAKRLELFRQFVPKAATMAMLVSPDLVAVIVANNISAIAAKAVTTTVPIVFTSGSDPVREGLVTSLNRPGGNVTGAVFITGVLGAKRLELFRQFVPKAATMAMLVS